MFLKSVFQNKGFRLFLFCFLLFLSALGFIFSFNINKYKIEIPLQTKLYADVRLNIETFDGGNVDIEGIKGKNTEDNFKVFINDSYELNAEPSPVKNSYKIYAVDNYPVYKISISNNNFKTAVLSIGGKSFYFNKNDLKKDDKGNYVFKGSYIKNSPVITDRGALKHFAAFFLSVFYNFEFYILPLLFLFGAWFVYRKKFKFFSIYLILIFAFLLRLSDLNSPLWTDELYTYNISNKIISSPLSLFSDPGNPPFYYFLVGIFGTLFGAFFGGAPDTPFAGMQNDILRFLSVIFSLASIYILYLFLKDFCSKKAALIAAFIISINIYSLISAHELRCYSFCIFLTGLISYLFFKTVKSGKGFNLAYFITLICAFNTHYFMSFVIFSHFILGFILIKNNNEKLKFVLLNIAAFISLIPFLAMTGIKKGLYDNNFNTFNPPDLKFYIDTFCYFAQGKIPTLIIFGLFIFLLIKRKFKPCYFYSLYMIVSVFVLTYIFSFIKPISKDYYFICLLPYFIILFSLVLTFEFKNKILKTVVIILLISGYFLNTNYIMRNSSKLLNFENIAEYYKFDKKDDNSMLLVPHSKEMLNEIYDINSDNIIIIYPPQTTDKLINAIENSYADAFYFKLEHKNFKEFLQKTYLKYNISYIRSDMDVIIMRVCRGLKAERAKGNVIED